MVKKKTGLKKNLSAFLKDEQGKMSSRSILKIGMGMIGALTVMSTTNVCADHGQYYGGGWDTLTPTHTSAESDDWGPGSHDNWSHYQYQHTSY